MSPELQQELAKWLGGLRENAGQAKDSVLDQAPRVIHDLVAMGRAESTACVVIGLAMLAVGAQWTRRLCIKSFKEMDDGPAFLGGMAMFGAALAGLLVAVAHAHQFVASWFAPRVYVIETIGSMLKGS